MKKQNLQSKFQYFEHGRKFIFPEQIIDAHICYNDIFIYNHVNMTVILLDFVGFFKYPFSARYHPHNAWGVEFISGRCETAYRYMNYLIDKYCAVSLTLIALASYLASCR